MAPDRASFVLISHQYLTQIINTPLQFVHSFFLYNYKQSGTREKSFKTCKFYFNITFSSNKGTLIQRGRLFEGRVLFEEIR